MANTANPSLSDLKALAAALPPSERVSSSEVADVLSALVATVAHGRAILDAGAEGGNAVYEFIHNEIAKVAEQNGDPQPQKGQALTQPAQPGAPVTPMAQTIDYDALAAAMLKAQAAQSQQTSAPEDVTATEGAPPAQPQDQQGNEGGIL